MSYKKCKKVLVDCNNSSAYSCMEHQREVLIVDEPILGKIVNGKRRNDTTNFLYWSNEFFCH